jgi:Ca-activated chloride channel family protein
MMSLRPACLLFLVLALTAGSAVGQQTGSQPDVRVVVTVTDSTGRPLAGLTQQQFSIFAKKTPLDITYFDAEDRPVSVALVFDLSKSMGPELRKHSAQIAATIIRDSNKNNEYAIIGVRKTPEVLCELGCDGTATLKVLQQIAASETKESLKTPLYDAYDLALSKLEQAKNAKRSLIVFTDGFDTASQISFPKLRDRLKESNVIFYALGFLLPDGSSFADIASSNLDELGDVTGGESYFPVTPNNMAEFANIIVTQLRQQYTIGFKPAEQTPDKKWHSIKIRLTVPDSTKTLNIYMRYREGYYSH